MTELLTQADYDRATAPEVMLPETAVRALAEDLQATEAGSLQLNAVRNHAVRTRLADLGRSLFQGALKEVAVHLADPDVGICAVDIPRLPGFTPTADAYWGAMTALALSENLMKPAMDRRNRTPFSLYNASLENEDALKKAGLKFFSPNEKLGFHNDGLLESEKVIVPETIMVYNLLIDYWEPGDFYWIPLSMWSDRERWREILGVGRKFKFRITPIVYPASDGAIEVTSPNEIVVPVFTEDDDGNECFFMNGEILESTDPYFASHPRLHEKLRDSLLENRFRFRSPIRARRAFFLRNHCGCHSRDIFEKPIGRSKITRSFIRAVDVRGPQLPTG